MAKPHELFTQLHQAIVDEEYDDVVKVSNKILAATPDDVDAFKCKITALIQQDKFDEVQKAIEGHKSRSTFQFEEAYVLYRLKKFKESLAFLENPQDKRQFELKAQVSYSLENFVAAVQIYETIIQKFGVTNNDLLINLCASYVRAGQNDKFSAFLAKNKEVTKQSFEFAYNVACVLIAQGDLTSAKTCLEEAIAMGQDSLKSDGQSEKDIANELAPLQTQLAYIKQRMGQKKEALEAYTKLNDETTPDAATKAVITNNMITLKDGERAHSYRHLTKLRSSEDILAKLTKQQKEAICFNLGLMLLQMNKIDECKELLKQLTAEFPANDLLPLISASLLLREKKPEQSRKLLEDFAAKHPESSTRTRLSIAQIYFNQSEIPSVIKTVESIESLRSSPAVISTLVSLYEAIGNIDGAVNVLDTGVKTLNKQADYYPSLLRKSADYKLKVGKYQDAAKIYRQILDLPASGSSSGSSSSSNTSSLSASQQRQRQSHELEILTCLVVAYAHFDPASARKFAARIAEVSGSKTGISDSDNGEELEKLAVPVFKRKEKPTTTTTTSGGKTTTTTATTINKKKKKRKNKPPKKIEPGKPVDPERWIPKQERSYYKGKRKGKQTGNKGAQGAVSASVAVQQATGTAVETPATASFEEFDDKPQKLTPQQLAQEKAANAAAAVQAAAAARGAKAGAAGARGRRGRGGRRK